MTVPEEDLRHRPDRCCVHRISADRPSDVDKDADLGACLLAGRRVVASWLVDPSSEHPKVLVVLSPAARMEPIALAPMSPTPVPPPSTPVPVPWMFLSAFITAVLVMGWFALRSM